MSILIKDLPLAGYEISIMKDGERYRARVDGIWCEVEEIPTTEPDSDTISRQAAIDLWEQYHPYIATKACEYDTMLRKLPSAKPERKTGRWIDGKRMKNDGTFYWFRQCDQCGYERNDCDAEKDSNFCPDCGADMRGEQDG